MCVLVVEDDDLIRTVLVEELEAAGYKVRSAANGDEAVAMLDGLNPPLSVLVTDVQMPGKFDGVALAAHVATTHPDIPVVYTTGQPAAPQGLADLGRRRVLVRKPYKPNDVVGVIRELTAA